MSPIKQGSRLSPRVIGATDARRECRHGRDKPGHDEIGVFLRKIAYACANSTSIRVPEWPPVLIWNWARLASPRALGSDRLSAELSEAWSDGAAVRNGCIAAATSLSLRPWPVSRTLSTTWPMSDSAVETMT